MVNAAIYDCENTLPTDDEIRFFRDAEPVGFILFADHCPDAQTARRHVDMLRDGLGRDDLLFLIDQEGGRVARMKPPAFPAHPPMDVFGKLWRLDPARAREAAFLNARLLAQMTAAAGINVNCVPMLDVPQIDSDPVVIGDRALAAHPDSVSALGRAVCEGSIAGGALPVIKHLPGHGRALCDSHHALPRIDAARVDLQATDFPPFRALADMPLGMTGHVVLTAYDGDLPATLSPTVIGEVIRGEIGFDGFLMSDDLRMGALGTFVDGDIGARAGASLAAGCDAALCCNFTMAEKIAVARGVTPLTADAARRLETAFGVLAGERASPTGADLDDAYERLAVLIRPGLNA